MIARAYITSRLHARGLDEVNGYADLGMFAEALLAAQDLLQQPVVPAEAFEASVNMVLSGADDLSLWKETIQSAYHRMNADGKRRSAYLMLWFFAASEEHARAAEFIPGKFSGPFAMVNLLFAMSTYLGLKRLDKAQRLIPRRTERYEVVVAEKASP